MYVLYGIRDGSVRADVELEDHHPRCGPGGLVVPRNTAATPPQPRWNAVSATYYVVHVHTLHPRLHPFYVFTLQAFTLQALVAAGQLHRRNFSNYVPDGTLLSPRGTADSAALNGSDLVRCASLACKSPF